jgi:hypothetical protein
LDLLPFAGDRIPVVYRRAARPDVTEEGVVIPPLLLLNLFVVIVMFSIGLRVSGGELLEILRKRACLSVPCWRIASSYRP